jgi:flagellar export protein FliJ
MDSANLSMLIELAKTARDAAATRCAQARVLVEQAHQQLELLRGYAREYDRRSMATLTQGVDLAAQNNLRAFVAKLTRAVEIQQAEVGHREAALASADAELVQMRMRLSSLEKLAERQEQTEQHKARRREQNTLDEMASRIRRNTGFGSNHLITSDW